MKLGVWGNHDLWADHHGIARALGLALVVCGHTHGGQVALPGGRPIIVPGAGGKIWPHGLHQVGGTPLFVSRGIGGIEIPLRAWAPPDVALFRLRG